MAAASSFRIDRIPFRCDDQATGRTSRNRGSVPSMGKRFLSSAYTACNSVVLGALYLEVTQQEREAGH